MRSGDAPVRATRLVTTAGMALTLASAAAGGTAYSPYFPLLDDWQWTYQGGSSTLSVDVTGERELLGRTVLVVTTVRDGDAPYETYFSVDDGGTVFLHGFDNPGIPATRAYEPPIEYLPRSPLSAAIWATTHTRYGDLEGADSLGVFTTRYEVVEETTLGVPAGTFDCLVIEGGAVKGGDRFAVDGRMTRGDDEGLDWFARDVGRIRRPGLATYDLVSYSGTVVPVRAVTWTRLKRAYGLPDHVPVGEGRDVERSPSALHQRRR